MKAEKSFSLKDQLYNLEKVEYLADQFVAVYPAFERDRFVQAVVERFPELELKERALHISEQLRRFLPDDYLDALDLILRALPPELDPDKTDDDFGDFIHSPLGEFVSLYGCELSYLERSLVALREITKRFSVEGPIRSFINRFPDQTMAFLGDCAKSENYHVRRLASEGTRPKLPWAQKLVIDYRDPLPILNGLYADSTRYVTRSVANHLNDISKINPKLVVDTLAGWATSRKQSEKEMGFITAHSLRTLVKKGDRAALTLLGYGAEPQIEITTFITSTPEVPIGTAFLFELELRSLADQNLMVDYLMQFAAERPEKKGGRKVFKLKQLSLKEGETIRLKKKHPMRLMTTRRLYLGEHMIELQVNGHPYGTLAFELTN